MKKNSKLQVLLATMNQKDDDLLKKMNIKTDIIVCNQTLDKFSKKEYSYEKNIVNWYNFMEKGVGLNRNNALMRSTSEICLIADDDVTYVDNYEKIIIKAFDDNKDADVILFNIYSDSKKRFICKKKMNVTRFNCGRFGGVRIAFRRKSIIKNSIYFNLLFGGGAMFSSGEDVMFIRDCIRKHLKVIAVPEYILKLREERKSTWFTGYNKKFFNDLGSSYVYHYGSFAYICALIQLRRKKNLWLNNVSYKNAKKWVKEGINNYKCL